MEDRHFHDATVFLSATEIQKGAMHESARAPFCV